MASIGSFLNRHIGPRIPEQQKMLQAVGYENLEALTKDVVPKNIYDTELSLPNTLTEVEALEELRSIFSKNKVCENYIGLGYYPTVMPAVIQRNIFENPGWYTQYTPYQAEISQGRLESLLNFQTMVCDLTGLPISNASLLDEPTAAAEAMMMFWNAQRGKKKTFLVAEDIFPQTLQVIQTRAKPLGVQVVCIQKEKLMEALTDDVFGVFVQVPSVSGELFSLDQLVSALKPKKIKVCVASDLMALTLIKSPGEYGVDVVVGSAQRFGVPMGFGGPHAGFFATTEEFKRKIPGRIVGVSKDRLGNHALRLALQTREQHIRRDKATSNICTAQALLANISAMYAVYHGKEGLVHIAQKIHSYAGRFLAAVSGKYMVKHHQFFDGVSIQADRTEVTRIAKICADKDINIYAHEDEIRVFFHESTNETGFVKLLECFEVPACKQEVNSSIPSHLQRQSSFLEHPNFRRYRSETQMLRYIKSLESADLSLTTSMIPLGSCTMKLNATTQMQALSWRKVGELHPFAPRDQVTGYLEMIQQLEDYLSECTGFDAFSLQPNAGSQGEFAGLLVIKKYHESKGQGSRHICLIPSSAHGTNPASAVMAGMKVVVVRCDDNGNIDLEDFREKANLYKDHLAAAMITYPSTHGVFEQSITEICDIVHARGGQVYLDGANMNAQIGLCKPGKFGADVCHLNLHKTFCIPHGGGGPGVGPIGVKDHLKDFLPSKKVNADDQSIGMISGSPFGSASILIISWAYIRLMGGDGLRHASEVAILSANYIAKKLDESFPVLYKGNKDLVAHECIVDLRSLQKSVGITVEDVAKRLIDYGFHAPTMAWPVPGTLMIEPTESESLEEIDRFCDAMISIRREISHIETKEWSPEVNPLKNAPHVLEDMTGSVWGHPYSMQVAVLPSGAAQKFWPKVSRVDNALGDRQLICQCLPLDAYSDDV